jgi:hypothetical protein
MVAFIQSNFKKFWRSLKKMVDDAMYCPIGEDDL